MTKKPDLENHKIGINDHKILSLREKAYERNEPLDTTELPIHSYLRRLSEDERNSLVRIFMDASFRLKRAVPPIMVLAVGTTTFPARYWIGLEKYLKDKDPSMLGFVERMGEDIDMLLCPDDYSKPNPEEWAEFLCKDLKDARLKFKFEKGKRENGTAYLTVPAEHVKNYNQKVLRMKGTEYGDSVIIDFPGTRDIHIFFEPFLSGEIKVKNERICSYPFSLLFRHGRCTDLADAVNIVNSQEELKLGYSSRYKAK